MNVASRLFSLIVLVAAWYAASQIAGERIMPGPQTVGFALWAEAQSGALAFHLGVTLARVAVAFVIAMAIGTALGVWRAARASPTGSPIHGWWRSSTCRRWSSSCSPMFGRA